MKGRLLAVAIAVGAAVPGVALAGDTPWSAIKKLFHEPVSELKQQLRQLEQQVTAPPKAAPGPKKPVPTAEEAPAPDTAVAVIPPPRPEPSVATAPSDTAGETPLDPAPAPTVTPQEAMAESQPVATRLPDPAPKDAAEPPDAETAAAPIPRPRPDVVISYAAEPPLPPSRSGEAFSALNLPAPSLTMPPPAARSTCGAELARLGVVASPLAPISEGQCGIGQPVSIASLGSGATDLTVNAIIECNLAETFARWLADEVQPEARKALGGEVTGLRVAASYHCRTRNGVSGAKLSEHGRGNAIDISAFKIAGRGWIAVGGGHSADEARFFKAIRKAACGPFTTVLGPGSDSYHSDHFHLDLAQRRKGGPSRGLYCR